eukprot:TRINITY_DN19103_c0_g1_i1.p1 TRINITY_DN19103_c0_g1~~TRINITY_DN19103_c0_g1_i1.p1  ORF type:complete len:272 (+),score=78.07 TRINITY_DN19103_c0_g1_i1:63-818(+)
MTAVVDLSLRRRITAFHMLSQRQLSELPLKPGKEMTLARDCDADAIDRFLRTYSVAHVQLGRGHPAPALGDGPNAGPDYVYVTTPAAVAELGGFAEAGAKNEVRRRRCASPKMPAAVSAVSLSLSGDPRHVLVQVVCWRGAAIPAAPPRAEPAPARRPARRAVDHCGGDWRAAFRKMFGAQPPDEAAVVAAAPDPDPGAEDPPATVSPPRARVPAVPAPVWPDQVAEWLEPAGDTDSHCGGRWMSPRRHVV